MSYLEYTTQSVPTGLSKVLYLNWPLVILVAATSAVGFLVLYSLAGGSLQPWSQPQMQRFGLGLIVMFIVAFIPIWFWRNVSIIAYVLALLLLVYVEFFGVERNNSQRWMDLGFMLFQPSELMKIAIVMLLAAYYDWLDLRKTSRPLWVLIPIVLTVIPVILIREQPDLGTALLVMAGGGAMMILAGVHWAYFATVIAGTAGLITTVFTSRGTDWQLITDEQFRRIDVFLDPAIDPLGDAYQITQAQIALGSGGWTGRGFLQGTQSQLQFTPDQHTDFVLTALAEEFGFVGTISLLVLYMLILLFCMLTALSTKDRYAMLVSLGVAATFFLYFALNMAMVTGLVPVVGSPLPLVSYGGSAMLVLMGAFGLVQSAHIHRPR